MYEDGIVHDILCDKLSGRHYHLELHCVPCNIKVVTNIMNFSLYIRIIFVTNPILVTNCNIIISEIMVLLSQTYENVISNRLMMALQKL